MRTIAGAEPLPASCIRLEWDDGTESVVDLTAVLAKGGVFAFLIDPAAFNAVAVGARGRTLAWQDLEEVVAELPNARDLICDLLCASRGS